MTRDAEGLADALRKDRFLVEAVDNATRADMTRAIDRLMTRVHSNSTVLVYFGGYGVQSDGQDYLIPVDAKIWNEADVRREGVSLDRLLSKLTTSGARVRLVVIEGSRRNPYERRFRAYSHGLAPIQTSENTLVMSSAAPGQVIEDSDEPHSELMTALLAQMNSSKGIEEVFRNTRNAAANPCARTHNARPAIAGEMRSGVTSASRQSPLKPSKMTHNGHPPASKIDFQPLPDRCLCR
jgi:uncharacterized caspase-like protein